MFFHSYTLSQTNTVLLTAICYNYFFANGDTAVLFEVAHVCGDVAADWSAEAIEYVTSQSDTPLVMRLQGGECAPAADYSVLLTPRSLGSSLNAGLVAQRLARPGEQRSNYTVQKLQCKVLYTDNYNKITESSTKSDGITCYLFTESFQHRE